MSSFPNSRSPFFWANSHRFTRDGMENINTWERGDDIHRCHHRTIAGREQEGRKRPRWKGQESTGEEEGGARTWGRQCSWHPVPLHEALLDAASPHLDEASR